MSRQIENGPAFGRAVAFRKTQSLSSRVSVYDYVI